MTSGLRTILPCLDDRMKSFSKQAGSFVNFISLLFAFVTTFGTPINHLNLKVIIVVKCRDVGLFEALFILAMEGAPLTPHTHRSTDHLQW